ncbi:MAG: 50S ribosomal protein L20 [bacterium]
MRVKRGTTHLKRRHNLLKRAKGYLWGRKSKPKLAKVAVLKAGANAYRDRRNKKRDFRGLWNIRINAGARLNDTTYSQLINNLKNSKIELDRKILSDLAQTEPEVFAEVVKQAK